MCRVVVLFCESTCVFPSKKRLVRVPSITVHCSLGVGGRDAYVGVAKLSGLGHRSGWVWS